MTTFLAIANTYTAVEMALFQDTQMLGIETIEKHVSSALLIPSLQALLAKHTLALSDCAFIAVNQGPGPFTTLRVVIASANGLSFASKIPLLGVDGLDAFLNEHSDARFPNTIALLNAFNKDVYFGIQINNAHSYTKGYAPITEIINTIAKEIPADSVRFIGNAASLYTEEIKAVFGARAFIPDPLPQTASLQQIGLMAWQQWHAHASISYQLAPLYLKQHSATLNIRN